MKILKPLSLAKCALTLRPRFSNTITDQKAEIAQLQAALKTATDQAALHQTALTQARADLADREATITAHLETIKEQKALLATRDAEIVTLNAQISTESQRASRLLATMGHVPLEIGTDANEAVNGVAGSSTSAGLIAHYNGLKDHKARAKFWNENFNAMYPKKKK